MRVLFDHSAPFALAHGGFQIQIEQTAAALRSIGVDVELLRWWDDKQQGDLIHYFGAASNSYLHQAATKGIPVVMTTLFTETCNRSETQLRRQGWMTTAILKLPFGDGVKQQLAWRAYRNCTHNIVGLQAERRVLEIVYRVPTRQISVVPLGLSNPFLRAKPGSRKEPHLICTGTITERKRSVELAQLAREANVPILFVGQPYSSSDPYWKRFQTLVDQRFVKYCPHVSGEDEMVQLLGAARGFVILSKYENWCLSAHEAAACGLPVLLPDQNWSRERFGNEARYFTDVIDSTENAKRLRKFYEWSESAPPPTVRLFSWQEVAGQLRGVYEQVLNTSR